VTYPTRALYEEVGYVAWHVHWPLTEILDLDHATRHEMVDVIGNLAERVAGA
jgi:hypothetical protein